MNDILTDSPFHKNWRFFGPSELCAPYLYWVEIFALTWYPVTIRKMATAAHKTFSAYRPMNITPSYSSHALLWSSLALQDKSCHYHGFDPGSGIDPIPICNNMNYCQ